MQKKQVVLITGASSYVGAGIYSYLKKYFNTHGTYNTNKLFLKLIKMDITNEDEVKKVVGKIKPNVIVHVAANPNAKWCEANKEEAIKLNETGTKHIVDAANSTEAKIIYISSFAVIKPTNVYGETKLAGEKITKKTNSGWIILRPSLIIGYSPNTTNDRPFNRLLKNITEHTPAVYDNSWKFQPTELQHLAEVIKVCIDKDINKETIPLSVPELKTRYEIAKDFLANFSINATAADTKDNSPIFMEKLDKLTELGLPEYTYTQIMERIISDTKKHLKI